MASGNAPVDKPAPPVDKPAMEVVTQLTTNDTFLLSTSEFVAPAIPVTYVKNKGVYLLFRAPRTSITLMPEMALWFKVTAFSLRAELSFRGEIYKIFGEGETTYPCIIVKTPEVLTLQPVLMDEGLSGIDLPVMWRRTATMKRGTLKRLTTKGGSIEVTEEGLRQGEVIRVQVHFEDRETDELPSHVDRTTPIEEGGNFLALLVEFTFQNLTPPQLSSIQKGITATKANPPKSKG